MDFIASKLLEDMAIGLMTSLTVSTVNGLEFTPASVSDIKVLREIDHPDFCHLSSLILIIQPSVIWPVSPIHLPYEWLMVDLPFILTNLLHSFSKMITLVCDPTLEMLVETLSPYQPLLYLKYLKFPLIVMKCLKKWLVKTMYVMNKIQYMKTIRLTSDNLECAAKLVPSNYEEKSPKIFPNIVADMKTCFLYKFIQTFIISQTWSWLIAIPYPADKT